MLNTDRVVTLQSSALKACHLDNPGREDVVRVYLTGNDPNSKGGGVEDVTDVDCLERRFHCPRSMLTDKPGAKYRLRLERIVE